MAPLKGHNSHVRTTGLEEIKFGDRFFQNLFLRGATFLSSLPSLLSSTSLKTA